MQVESGVGCGVVDIGGGVVAVGDVVGVAGVQREIQVASTINRRDINVFACFVERKQNTNGL